MVSCVRGTGQTLSNVDDFVREHDFCMLCRLCSLAGRILFIILFVGAKGFSTSVTLKSQILNLFVRISAEIVFFPNIRRSFTKFLNCVSPASSIDLIRSNTKSGTTVDSLFILCSFVDTNGFIGNLLENVLMSNSKFLQEMSLSSWCFVERALLADGFVKRALLPDGFVERALLADVFPADSATL